MADGNGVGNGGVAARRNNNKHALYSPPPPSRLHPRPSTRPRWRPSLRSLNLSSPASSRKQSNMFVSSLIAVALAAIPQALAQAPIEYDLAHNATPIIGTWSSGSQQVLTGPVSIPSLGFGASYSPTLGFCESRGYDLHLPQCYWHFVCIVSFSTPPLYLLRLPSNSTL